MLQSLKFSELTLLHLYFSKKRAIYHGQKTCGNVYTYQRTGMTDILGRKKGMSNKNSGSFETKKFPVNNVSYHI